MNAKETVKTPLKNGEARDSRAERAIRLLMTADCDPKQQKRRDFEKFYPAVLHALRQKVPRKTILKRLGEGGLKLYPALFEEFLDVMGDPRKVQEEGTVCDRCGQAIQPNVQQLEAVLPEVTSDFELNDGISGVTKDTP